MLLSTCKSISILLYCQKTQALFGLSAIYHASSYRGMATLQVFDIVLKTLIIRRVGIIAYYILDTSYIQSKILMYNSSSYLLLDLNNNRYTNKLLAILLYKIGYPIQPLESQRVASCFIFYITATLRARLYRSRLLKLQTNILYSQSALQEGARSRLSCPNTLELLYKRKYQLEVLYKVLSNLSRKIAIDSLI